MNYKKLLKCFIPYGFLYLRQKLADGIPLKFISSPIIESIPSNCLCNTTIKILAGENNILEIQREDYEHPIYLRNLTSDVWVYWFVLENHEYSFSVDAEPKFIIDAGANIGMASIYFASKFKNAKIIAIEPEEENYKLLMRNTINYSNITALNAALWNEAGEISLFDTGLDNIGFMVEKDISLLKTSNKKIKHLTKTVTVDEIMHDFNIDSIDIFKIDIEGAEKEIFEKCDKWITNTKCIIIELHERMKKGCNKALYKKIKPFDQIYRKGEDIYLSKNNYIRFS